MPGFLLHIGANVTCAHQGIYTSTGSNLRVWVSGQPLMIKEAPGTIAGCPLPPPPNGNGPCTTASWVTSATRVFSNGMPVLLMDSQAICAPSGAPLTVKNAQTRVTGI